MSTQEFQTKVISLQDFLKPYALNLTNDLEDTYDLLQETMFKALSNREKFEQGTNIKAWLYTIMKNIFINNYRRKTKMRITTDGTENNYYLDHGRQEEPNRAQSKMVMDDLMKIVASLPDEYRVPFIRHYEGFKYQEIADELELPLGTVKSRIFFARKELKQVIKNSYGQTIKNR
ncbi:MAG: RNA polymerase sigma factor, partial [Bacteroidia bacterium]